MEFYKVVNIMNGAIYIAHSISEAQNIAICERNRFYKAVGKKTRFKIIKVIK